MITNANRFRTLKKQTTLIIIGIFFILMSASVLLLDILLYAKSPAGEEIEPKTIIIHPGEPFSGLVQRLYKEGIISSRFKFTLYARMNGYAKRIKAGEYSFFPTMSPEQLIDVMISGKVVMHRITIPEGFTAKQVAEVLSKAGLASIFEFMEAIMDSEFASENGIDASSLEGYLFPDTYHFSKMTPTRKIITTMTNRLQSVLKPAWSKEADRLGFSIHQIITLASIIEKETSIDSERPIIASVFHNRLKKRMKLESDPTVIYGIWGFDGNIKKRHLSEPTPYNTYQIHGLPPGPIANPGARSIEAALFPAKTGFLYFVSKNDGTHEFSEDFGTHKLAVKKYQMRKKS